MDMGMEMDIDRHGMDGVRIRVGNTDAEGRMAMVDVLCR